MDNKLKIATIASLIFLASGSALAEDANPLKPILGEKDSSVVLGDQKEGNFFTKDVPKDDPCVLGKCDGNEDWHNLPQYLLDYRRRHEAESTERRCSDNVRPGTVIFTNPPIYNCDDLAREEDELKETIRAIVIEILEELTEQGNFQDLLKGEEKLN